MRNPFQLSARWLERVPTPDSGIHLTHASARQQKKESDRIRLVMWASLFVMVAAHELINNRSIPSRGGSSSCKAYLALSRIYIYIYMYVPQVSALRLAIPGSVVLDKGRVYRYLSMGAHISHAHHITSHHIPVSTHQPTDCSFRTDK